jgi:hypothetical protein
MAIRINLLAEAQAAEELRRKNPVKRAIWIGSFCVALILLWILKLQVDIEFSKSKYNSLNQSWTNNIAKYAAVTNNEVKINEADKKLAALDRLATNRFYWDPVLNALQKTMINGIQVVRVTGEQKYVKEEPRALGAEGKVKLPGAMIERIGLYIEAKDYDPNAQNYDKFKETLCNFDFFVKHLRRRDGFILDSLSSPTADPSDPNRQFVLFKLTCHFPETRRIE